MHKRSSQLMTTCRAGKGSETSLTWESTRLEGSEVKIMQLRSVFHYLDLELERCESTRTDLRHFGHLGQACA